MNESSFTTLIGLMARGDGPGAQRYLSHFPKAERAPGTVRDGLASRLPAEVMDMLMGLHPWLMDQGEDDTPARIRLALHAAGTTGLTRVGVRDKVSGVAGEPLGLALDALVEAREVVVELKRGKGRPADVFRLAEFAGGIVPKNAQADPFAFRPAPFKTDAELEAERLA